VIQVRVVEHGSPAYWSTVELRRRILRAPLGLDFQPEELAAEVDELHLAAFEDGRDPPVACLVLVPQEAGTIKMRQVAVEPGMQGRGVGSLLVAAAEAEAVSRGFTKMILHARDTAVPFYLRLDYAVNGDAFDEVTIPHFAMEKDLRSS
jgi:GNAT superfamily N-acetyltransferase